MTRQCPGCGKGFPDSTGFDVSPFVDYFDHLEAEVKALGEARILKQSAATAALIVMAEAALDPRIREIVDRLKAAEEERDRLAREVACLNQEYEDYPKPEMVEAITKERDLALQEVERLKTSFNERLDKRLEECLDADEEAAQTVYNDLRRESEERLRRAEAAEERATEAERKYNEAMLFVSSFRDCQRCADAVKTCDHWKGVEWAMFDRAHLESVKKGGGGGGSN